MRSAKEDNTSGGRKPQEIEHDRRLGRKLQEKTVRRGVAGLTEEQNKELTTKMSAN